MANAVNSLTCRAHWTLNSPRAESAVFYCVVCAVNVSRNMEVRVGRILAGENEFGESFGQQVSSRHEYVFQKSNPITPSIGILLVISFQVNYAVTSCGN